jgi:hypothetical protein
MDDDRVQEIQLPAGAGHCIRVRRGTVILVRRGRVVLRPPMAWLAERVVTAEIRLDAEENYVASSAGNVELIATRAADVLVVSRAARGHFIGLCRFVRRAWRQRIVWKIVE